MFGLTTSSDLLWPTNSILFNRYRIIFLVQSCRGVQVTRIHPEPRAGKDWADVSMPLYVIHEVVPVRVGSGNPEASVLQKSSLIG
jgi:hypothetical protein